MLVRYLACQSARIYFRLCVCQCVCAFSHSPYCWFENQQVFFSFSFRNYSYPCFSELISMARRVSMDGHSTFDWPAVEASDIAVYSQICFYHNWETQTAALVMSNVIRIPNIDCQPGLWCAHPFGEAVLTSCNPHICLFFVLLSVFFLVMWYFEYGGCFLVNRE